MTAPTEQSRVTQELLPCPFCGGKAMHGSTLDNSFYVMCERDSCLGMVGYCETADAAIAAWNARLAPASEMREIAARVEWRPAEEAPVGWHPTYRLGEARATLAYKADWGEGGIEWSAPDGRTTVTHSTYPAPTHYLAFRYPPLPTQPTGDAS